MPSEKRNRPRKSTILMAELTYEQPSGVPARERAVVLNISEGGCLVETKRRYPTRAYVRIEIKELNLKGMASVRYSDPKGIDYRTGLEFAGGLRYVPSPPPMG
jgi:hypothetical protein